MKAAERDELLIRVDERTLQLVDISTKQEGHLDRLNGSVQKNITDIAVLQTQRKMNKKEAGGIGVVVTGMIIALWKSFTGQ